MDDIINKPKLSFPVMFQKIEDVNIDDERFTRVKIWLMHLGENCNGVIFEKSVVDAALSTLQYIPIVGFMQSNSINENDFSQHKVIKIQTKNGGKELKYLGHAYGVILSNEDNNAHYEERLCDDGETRTFLVVDGIIWNMFEDSSDIVLRDLIKSNSVELWDKDENSYDGYEDEDGKFHFTRFSFRAACILGKDYEPAMENSTIEVQFAMCNFVKAMQSELDNKYTAFTKGCAKNKQGGKNNMSNNKTHFSQTVFELLDDIRQIVRQAEQYFDRWGDNMPRYDLHDIQDNEVIVVDRKNNYQLYGFPLTINGDKPTIDFACAKRKKTSYTDYEDDSTQSNNMFNFGKCIEDIENTAFAKIEEANKEKDTAVTQYQAIKSDYDEIKPKYDAYVSAEQEAANNAILEEKNTLFKKFDTHLSDVDEYAKIKESMNDLSVEEIEAKCSVLFTKKSLSTASTNYSKSKNTNASVDIPDSNDDTDGEYVQTKYGLVRKYN